MRAAGPNNPGDGAALKASPKTEDAPSGWEPLCSFCDPSVFVDSKNLSRCPNSQAPNARLPFGVGWRTVGDIPDYDCPAAGNFQHPETLAP